MKPIETLEPAFRSKVVSLLEELQKETGYKWIVVGARRTMQQQSLLYAQGRTMPGDIVTHAKAGMSPHNFGLGVDIVPLPKKWAAPDKLFKQMADIAIKHGFVAGYYFKSIHDSCHLEDPQWKVVQGQWFAGQIEVA